MKSEYAIEVSNITKSFKVYLDKGRTIKEKILFQKRRRYEERMVLKGISFQVKKGEAIGLIGQNGCGKSTTLKLLTKIMYPDTGSIQMCGRVSSLIELGAGFHPDMSGRQNIYTNASIFGLTRKEIDKRLEDIIAFSELEEFIDNPVRTYSSGMYMRLAFSVAINVDADILLIDEILAVGDSNFQAKCFNKLREIKANGTTIVIVSHSLGQIEQICEKSIWIQDGKIKIEGRPRDVHPRYLEFMGEKRQETIEKEEKRTTALASKEERKNDKSGVNKIGMDKFSINTSEVDNSKHSSSEQVEEKDVRKDIDENDTDVKGEVLKNAIEKEELRFGNKSVMLESIELYDKNNKKKHVFRTGEVIQIKFNYKVKKVIEDACFGIGIFRSDGIHCYGTNTRVDRMEPFGLNQDGMVVIEMINELLPGEYFIDLAIESEPGVYADYCKKICSFITYTEKEDIGISRLLHEWKGNCFLNAAEKKVD